MSETVVKIRGLSKSIKGNIILDNINLNFDKGKIYGIVGRNGSGKSILFKSISGLIRPSKGTITVFDEVIGEGNFPKDFGVLLDVPGFLPQYSSLKNLRILASINNKATDKEIRESIITVGLNPDDKKPVKKYSLGMKQRLGIAQAIMENPKLLILDEPMNGLDEEGVTEIRRLLADLKKRGVTIILSSHNPEDIAVLCDYVYKINNGVIMPRHSIEIKEIY